jgi:hypothetical protein
MCSCAVIGKRGNCGIAEVFILAMPDSTIDSYCIVAATITFATLLRHVVFFCPSCLSVEVQEVGGG